MPQPNQDSNIRFTLLAGLVLAAAMCRLLPPSVNFAPIGAIALFGGACFASRRAAFLVPISALLLSDVVLNFTRYNSMDSTMVWTMSALTLLPFLLIVCLGFALQKNTRNVAWLVGGSLGASAIFFIVSNFAWYLSPWNVAPTLGQCYLDAVPFFRGTLASDAIYTTLLFGMLALVESKVPVTKPQLAEIKVDNQ
jgi:hypothetical protein